MNTRASQPSSYQTFADSVRGVDTQSIDTALARINADVYNESGSRVGNWSPVPTEQLSAFHILPGDVEDTHIGFRARIYSDGEGHYVLAFCGSNETKDWKHNIRQATGLQDVQYEHAIELARKARWAFGDNVVLTGHSLGGGLASVGALATNSPAVTFNSAGLHRNTIERLGLDADAVRNELSGNGQIRRYSVDHEILTTLQERNLLTRGLLPDAIGHEIELPDPHPVHGWKKLMPGSSLRHGLDMHGIDSVMEAQQLAAHGSMASPAHPAHGMFNAALGGLKGIQVEVLGFRSEEDYRNAAGALTVKAREAGMQRIDHVVVGANGALFAVEGPLEDASHRIASVDRSQAAAQSIEVSSQLLQAQASQPGTVDTQVTQQQQQQQRNRALAP